MRRRFLILVLLALPVVADAQPSNKDIKPEAVSDGWSTCPYGMGPGMGGGMMSDDWGAMGPGMMGVYALDLTDKQRGQLSEIQGDLIKPMWDLARKVDEQRTKLYEAYAADPVDSKRVREISETIGRLHQQIAETRANAHHEMMKVLTKDQREQLSSMRRGMHGPRMMNRKSSMR